MERAATRRQRAPLPVTKEPDLKQPAVTEEDVRRRAFELYLERGTAPGDEVDDWLRAERDLMAK